MRDPFAVVASSPQIRALGWAERKALVLLVATDGDWNGASSLADALGIEAEDQEPIYRESLTHKWRLTGGPS